MSRRNRREKNNSPRKLRSRYSGDTALIVCEGTETEPNYLIELKSHLSLDQAALDIVPSSGSAPNTVIKHAKKAIKEACAKGNPYSKVYCVIDKDQHPTYASAMEDIRIFNEGARNPCGTVLCAISSVPCFEYWILMHYEPSSQSYNANRSSPCKQLISTSLRTHVPGYQKADRAFARKIIMERLATARHNSATTRQRAVSAGTDDPSTKMHLLIDELEHLKKHKHFQDDRKGCPQ